MIQAAIPNLGQALVAMAKIGNTVIAGSGSDGYRSTDLGLTWELMDTTLFGHGLYCVLAVNNDFIAGTNSDMLISYDTGRTWVPFDDGLPQGYTQDAFQQSMIEFKGYVFAVGSNLGLFSPAPFGFQ
ncbi:MAG TPA: hypothetical protein VGM92_08935 [Candidatus Kapabacteria bacterium]|jgi:photosystem II stability/assembly factor-like uncharacterized protein